MCPTCLSANTCCGPAAALTHAAAKRRATSVHCHSGRPGNANALSNTSGSSLQPPPASDTCQALPGTAARAECYRQRLSRGEAIFNAADLQDDDQHRGRAPRQKTKVACGARPDKADWLMRLSVMAPEKTSIAGTLRREIRSSGLSQAELARQIGISESAISRFLSGTTDLPLCRCDQLLRKFDLQVVRREEKE